MIEKKATIQTHIRNQSEPITSSQGFKASGSGVQITSAILWKEIYSLNYISFSFYPFFCGFLCPFETIVLYSSPWKDIKDYVRLLLNLFHILLLV